MKEMSISGIMKMDLVVRIPLKNISLNMGPERKHEINAYLEISRALKC